MKTIQGDGADGDIELEKADSGTGHWQTPHVDFKGLIVDHRGEEVVGLGVGTNVSDHRRRSQVNGLLDDDEERARSKSEKRPIALCILGYYTAFKIFFYYLISLSSFVALALTIGLTIYWYNLFSADSPYNGKMDWVLLGFAVITPLSLAFGMAFTRREKALVEIAKFRSFSFQLYISHCLWDWEKAPKGKAGCDIDWVQHADDVMAELINIGDELCRFLTLPTTSRARHRVTHVGRHEAARTADVAYRLYDSLYTKRMIALSNLAEKIKMAGLPAGEVSRMRQYERFMGDAFENLRMVKTYRTPQTLRSFARIFTSLLPPFFAPFFAELGHSCGSLAVGIVFAVITVLCLTALLEGVEILEDPFVAFVTLDGIDVREEFQVLHWQQLMNARSEIFPQAMPFGDYRPTSAGNLADDVEKGNGSQSGLGSNSKAKKSRKKTIFTRRGDDILLANAKNNPAGKDEFRKTSYQMFGQQSLH